MFLKTGKTIKANHPNYRQSITSILPANCYPSIDSDRWMHRTLAPNSLGVKSSYKLTRDPLQYKYLPLVFLYVSGSSSPPPSRLNLDCIVARTGRVITALLGRESAHLVNWSWQSCWPAPCKPSSRYGNIPNCPSPIDRWPCTSSQLPGMSQPKGQMRPAAAVVF